MKKKSHHPKGGSKMNKKFTIKDIGKLKKELKKSGAVPIRFGKYKIKK